MGGYILEFPFAEEGNGINYDPGKRSTKVHQLVHHKTHYPYRKGQCDTTTNLLGQVPVASVSFLHHAYHAAHNFSGTERDVLTSDIV